MRVSVAPVGRSARARRGRDARPPRLTSLHARLTLWFLGLFVAVFAVVLSVAAASVAANTEHMVQRDLEANATVFDRVWRLRTAQMQSSADVLAQDFGFRAAVATRDTPTIGSALGSLRRRLGFDAAFVVDPDGSVIGQDGLGGTIHDLAAVQTICRSGGEASVFEWSGRSFQAVSSTVRAPTPMGRLVFANELNGREMASLARLSPISVEPQLIAQTADGRWRAGARGLSGEEQGYAARELAQVGAAAAPHARKVGQWMEVVRPLPCAGPERAALLLRYPAAAALEPYRGLLALVLSLGAAGILMVAIGGWVLARGVTRPIEALQRAAEQLERGESTRVEVVGRDEVAGLGRTFNRMAEQILRREEALAQARINAESANRAKSDFLANMSHEIRTPLNGILGMAQVMSREDADGRHQARLGVIRDSGEALLAVLNSILDLAKIEAGHLEIESHPFELADVVAAACDPFGVLAREKGLGFAVRIDPAAAGPRIGDPLRLRQVLSNLCSNAVKFTETGSVTISVSGGPAGVRFAVTDTGVGIARERWDEVFAKFSQVDSSSTRKFGGTGLGLAICRELVSLMGGTLALDSEPGRGSTFSFELALARTEPARAAGPSPEGPQLPERPLRILAAEDNPTNQMIISALLGLVGAEVTLVDDGGRALEAFRAAEFDLVLMDVQMPRMNGIEATRAIRAHEAQARRPPTPIVAVSANVMTHQLAEYTSAGMDGVVPKPVQAEALFAEIERVLAGPAAEPETRHAR